MRNPSVNRNLEVNLEVSGRKTLTCRCSSRSLRRSYDVPGCVGFGRFGITIFRRGRKRSGSRNCAISIEIRYTVDWCRVLRTGSGAVFCNGRQERKGGLRSSVRPRRRGENSLGCCQRSASPILPHRTREGWGNQIEVLIRKDEPAPNQA